MINRYIIGIFISAIFLLSENAIARVELIELSHESNKIKITIESRSPISFEYYTNEKTHQFGVTLEGDDYYPELTKYFQSIDIDSLGQCIDEITIVPISDNSARFEVRLANGLVASAYDDTANSPRNFRVIIQFVALDKNNSACFSGAGSVMESEGIAGTISEPEIPPAVVITDPSAVKRPLNAAQMEQEEQLAQGENVPETETTEMRPTRSAATRYSAYFLYDVLSLTNKGGFKGDDWLKQEASSEIRAAEVGLFGNYGDLDYQVKIQSMNNSEHEQKVSLYRAWLGYVGAKSVWQLRAGIMAEPFGADILNDLDRLPFLEQSLTRYLGNEYNPGILAKFGSDDWLTVELGAFGKRSNSSEPSSEKSTTARLLYTPFKFGDAALTVGYSIRQWEPIDNTVVIAARPESNLILPLFNLAQVDVDSVSSNGINMFMSSGSLMMSVETITSTLEPTSTALAGGVKEISARSFWGSWMITGEKRRIQNGQLQRVKPLKPFSSGGKGWGALEAGLRLSEISDSQDQKLSATSIGAVWSPYNFLQLKLNWVFALQAATTVDTVDNDADIVEFRLQVQY